MKDINFLLKPVVHDWIPFKPLNTFKSTWISIMQLLDEVKTPRHYQRQLIHVLNNNLLSHVTEGSLFFVLTTVIILRQLALI